MPDQFDTLWDVLPHPPGSVVRVFCRGGDERDGDFATSARELRRFARAHRDKNVYVAPNPTGSTGGARHSASDVTHWSYFLIDMDPVEKSYDALEALYEALLWFGEWNGRNFTNSGKGPQPPIIIDSGRGMQAWIRFANVELTDDKRFEREKVVHAGEPGGGSTAMIYRATARRVNSYWLKKLDEKLGVTHGCRIDTSVSDLPRVMRMPGTVNQKTKRRAKFLKAHDYVYHGLAEILVGQTPRNAIIEPEPVEGVEPGQPWQAVYTHLTRMAQTYLTQGQAEPGRHKVMWHTAKKLRELGVSRREARKALRWANGLQGEDEALPEDQVKHALDTAYGV